MKRTRGWLGPMLIVPLIVALAIGAALVRSMGSAGPGPERDSRIAEVEELRAAVAHCTEELAEEEERFRAHEGMVDSLRAAVTGYESEERTVPAGEFAEYLEAFTAYNESVDDWQERAAELQARWEECREVAERHNALVDSLSGRSPVVPTPGAG